MEYDYIAFTEKGISRAEQYGDVIGTASIVDVTPVPMSREAVTGLGRYYYLHLSTGKREEVGPYTHGEQPPSVGEQVALCASKYG